MPSLYGIVNNVNLSCDIVFISAYSMKCGFNRQIQTVPSSTESMVTFIMVITLKFTVCNIPKSQWVDILLQDRHMLLLENKCC